MEGGSGEDDISSLLSSFDAKMKNMEKVDVLESSRNNETGENPLKIVKEATISSLTKSFINVVTTENMHTMVNFRKVDVENLEATDFELKIPVSSVREVNDRMSNSLHGYFIGKRVAFPVVENYVFNAWGKYGIQKIMMNAKGFYFFKFSTKKGVDDVLENGPWMIHDVPMAAFTADGLSAIASKIGTPIMLDSYTSTMCNESWGRNSYARAMVEIYTDTERKETMVIAIPNLEDNGYTRETVTIEYEWKPPCCTQCKIFGHVIENCPHLTKGAAKRNVEMDNEGFQTVGNHGSGKKQNERVMGFKQKNFVYRPVSNVKSTTNTKKKVNEVEKSSTNTQNKAVSSRNQGKYVVSTSNSYSVLNETNDNFDEDDMENVYDETGSFLANGIEPRPYKQKEVRQVINENHLLVCAILESHVDIAKLEKVCAKVCINWNWTSNGSQCTKGSRIILGWNADMVDIMVISQTDQVMHVLLLIKADQKAFYCSFVYAGNDYRHRRELWRNLCVHKQSVTDKPWVLMGDFNAALNTEDTFFGSSDINIAMREFRECVETIEVGDVNSTGLHYTWNQKPKADTGMLRKIDRVLSNMFFTNEFPGSYVVFQPYRISDHAPAVLKIQQVVKTKQKPFKFSNFIVHKAEFNSLVLEGWQKVIKGYNMFKIVKKLKLLKKPLRKLVMRQGNLHERVNSLRHELDEVQRALDKDPTSHVLREEEAIYLKTFNEALIDEERFLKQKAKVEWLCLGDTNSSYFHKMVKARVCRSRIEAVNDSNNVLQEGSNVPKTFVDHYINFLGAQGDTTPLNTNNLFSKKLMAEKATFMVREVTNEEIKGAMFAIGNDKAPGPDGYTSVFFKKSWDIVGSDVCNAVRDFFSNGKLLQEINHTILALIPKVSTSSRINDYHLISCCNVIYKCICKIITNRLKEGLGDVVSDNQSAFVPGRSISDNILLTHELMHKYHLNKGPPRCAFKVDIQKAYDTVDWQFLKSILLGFGFDRKMVSWIMACVSSTTFSLCINGELHGYFKGKRGLRQGDPMSLYLFTLVMEILTLILKTKDNLILFTRGDLNSAKIIMESLQEFKEVSGLVPSIPKSTAFFCNVGSHVKASILQIMPFEADINQLMRGFLWCHGDMKRGKAKVAWDDLCLPKHKGGLAIRHLERFNMALMTKHIWNIVVRKESMWVRWIHAYKLKSRSFWDVPIMSNVSWGWRKILQIRNLVRPHLWHKIGNGKNTSAWFDLWCEQGPICNHLSVRSITREGFNLLESVKDIVHEGSWTWPSTWNMLFPVLNHVTPLILFEDIVDQVLWKTSDGKLEEFATCLVWDTIRPRGQEVSWVRVAIPRNGFHAWLIMCCKLKTHDKLKQWDVGASVDLNLL
ncbi:uncharacterized protein Tco_0388888, partial [Tanacetum coccineum]